MRFSAIIVVVVFVSWALAPAVFAQSNRYGLPNASSTTPPQPTADSQPPTGGGLNTGGLGSLDLPDFGGDTRQPFGASSQPPAALSNVLPNSPTANATPNRVTPTAPQPPSPGASASPTARANNAYATGGSAASTPAVDAASNTPDSSLAKEMMGNVMRAPSGSQLRGNPTRLVDVVAGANQRNEQTHRIEVYWDLCSSVADYYLSLRELDELNRLLSRTGSSNRALSQAVTEMQVRVDTSRRAALVTQLRLASAMGNPTLPLPADLPHVGGYETHYTRIFAGQQASEAGELNKVIPLRHAELLSAADAIDRAEDWLQTKTATQDAEEIVRAMELLALRRRAFVQIAKDYNLRIAHYTELATPGVLPTPRLVGMLIKSSAAASTASRSTVTPGSPYGPQSSVGEPGATFVGDWNRPSLSDQDMASAAFRDERIVPASAPGSVNPLREGERSVVKQPELNSHSVQPLVP